MIMYGGWSYGSNSYGGGINWRLTVEKLGSFVMDLWGYVNKASSFPIQIGIITLSKIKVIVRRAKERVRTKYKFH